MHKIFRRFKEKVRPYLNKAFFLIHGSGKAEIDSKDILYAFYDLEVTAASYDILNFLVMAENERIARGCSRLHVIFVPANTKDGFIKWPGDYKLFNTDENIWRFRNLLIPCCWLIPSCRSVCVCTTRDEANFINTKICSFRFPSDYIVSIPYIDIRWKKLNESYGKYKQIQHLSATEGAKKHVALWMKGFAYNKKVVTITLRESTYSVKRNSNLKSWGDFARSLDPAIYFPVIVRDTERAMEPVPSELKGIEIFKDASWNIELRMALYELSYLNLGISNGPPFLAFLNKKTRVVIYKMVTDTEYASSPEYMAQMGIVMNSQFEWASPYQRLVWENDDFNTISHEFDKMVRGIEGN